MAFTSSATAVSANSNCSCRERDKKGEKVSTGRKDPTVSLGSLRLLLCSNKLLRHKEKAERALTEALLGVQDRPKVDAHQDPLPR